MQQRGENQLLTISFRSSASRRCAGTRWRRRTGAVFRAFSIYPRQRAAPARLSALTLQRCASPRSIHPAFGDPSCAGEAETSRLRGKDRIPVPTYWNDELHGPMFRQHLQWPAPGPGFRAFDSSPDWWFTLRHRIAPHLKPPFHYSHGPRPVPKGSNSRLLFVGGVHDSSPTDYDNIVHGLNRGSSLIDVAISGTADFSCSTRICAIRSFRRWARLKRHLKAFVGHFAQCIRL